MPCTLLFIAHLRLNALLQPSHSPMPRSFFFFFFQSSPRIFVCLPKERRWRAGTAISMEFQERQEEEEEEEEGEEDEEAQDRDAAGAGAGSAMENGTVVEKTRFSRIVGEGEKQQQHVVVVESGWPVHQLQHHRQLQQHHLEADNPNSQNSQSPTRSLDRSRSTGRRGARRWEKERPSWTWSCNCRPFLLCCLFLLMLVFPTLQWLLSFPPPSFKRRSPPACKDQANARAGYVVSDSAVCTDACGKVCFPRIRGLCIAHNRVTVCGKVFPGTQVPANLRLSIPGTPRAKVQVRRGSCPERDRADWIRGTHMVADLKMMPVGPGLGPNPHHEAEKLVPAILLSHLYGLNKSKLFWFADPSDPSSISRWSTGLLEAFSEGLEVDFLDVPGPGERPVCFEDAVLFSGLTNAGYVPGAEANDWLRERVLGYCGVAGKAAQRPLADVVLVRRSNSSRPIANLQDVEDVLQKELLVGVRHVTSGVGGFCDQVRVVAEADFLLTPHGSHNINVLFARPQATVFEAFPLLYYIDWFRNYVHAAGLNHYELYGTWPTEEGGMPFKMRVFALLVGWRHCFSVRQCMNYAKGQRVFVDLEQLESELHKLTTTCRIAVQGSWCQTTAARNAGLMVG